MNTKLNEHELITFNSHINSINLALEEIKTAQANYLQASATLAPKNHSFLLKRRIKLVDRHIQKAETTGDYAEAERLVAIKNILMRELSELNLTASTDENNNLYIRHLRDDVSIKRAQIAFMLTIHNRLIASLNKKYGTKTPKISIADCLDENQGGNFLIYPLATLDAPEQESE